jgi:hypothetical protein
MEDIEAVQIGPCLFYAYHLYSRWVAYASSAEKAIKDVEAAVRANEKS